MTMKMSGGRAFQAEGTDVQRPGGKSVSGWFEEEQGGSCGWSKVSEQEQDGGAEGKEVRCRAHQACEPL